MILCLYSSLHKFLITSKTLKWILNGSLQYLDLTKSPLHINNHFSPYMVLELALCKTKSDKASANFTIKLFYFSFFFSHPLSSSLFLLSSVAPHVSLPPSPSHTFSLSPSPSPALALTSLHRNTVRGSPLLFAAVNKAPWWD